MTGRDLKIAAELLGVSPEWIRVVTGRALVAERSLYSGIPDHALAAKYVEIHAACMELAGEPK